MQQSAISAACPIKRRRHFTLVMHGRLKPNRSASAGATGNIYEMSFVYERLKKIKINAIQMTSSKAGLKPLGWRGISSARRMLRHKIETHGRKPAMMTGTK